MKKYFLLIVLILMSVPSFGQISGNPACQVLRQTGQTLPSGLWRTCIGAVATDEWSVQRTLDSSGAFGSTVNVILATGSSPSTIGVSFPLGGVTVGATATTTGTVNIAGGNSGLFSLTVPATAGTWTLTMPASAGVSGYIFATNGSGGASWVANPVTALNGSGTANQLAFFTSALALSSSSNLGWDGTNLTLGSGKNLYSDVWQDYSATSTIGGWGSFTTKQLYYKKIGKTIWVNYVLAGTSNGTTISFTLPYAATGPTFEAAAVDAFDNGIATTTNGYSTMSSGSSTVNVFSLPGSGAWTNTNTKQVRGQFFYETP